MPDTKDKSQKDSKVIPRGEIDRRRSSRRNSKRRVAVLCAAAAAVILLIVFFASGGYEKILDLLGIKHDISVTPVLTYVDCEVRGEPVVGGTGNTVIIYDEQGVTGYSQDGKWKWNEPCSLSSPSVSYCGGTVVYTDSQGTAAYAFNEDGSVWRYGSEQKIRCVFGNGEYVCMIHDEDSYLSAVSVFKYDSKKNSLQELFTRKFGSHYMVAGAVSDDGKQMAVSGVYSEGGTVSGIISFMRMSDGEIFSSESTEKCTYVKMFYTDDGKLFAANGNSLRVIYHSLTASSKDDMSSEIWNRNGAREMMTAAALSGEEYIMAAFGTEDSEVDTVKIYDDEGRERVKFEISGNIIGMHSFKDTVMLYTDRYVYLYSRNGLLIGTQEAGFKISSAVCIGDRRVAVCGEDSVIEVSFLD